MVPGASLIVVLNSVIRAGRGVGFVTAWAHALAVGIYALASLSGLQLLLVWLPDLLLYVRLFGSCFLLYMAVSLWRSPAFEFVAEGRAGFRQATQGFLVAFLNPKLAIFFLAVFSQFVEADVASHQRLLMALIAMLVDGLWYSAVVAGVSQLWVLNMLRRQAQIVSRICGLILAIVAVSLIWQMDGLTGVL
jgi:threonine/homoserine/homoserine lactone efflux protein